MIESIDEIVRQSLTEFVSDIFQLPWSGRREREAVSLYVLGYLIKHVKSDGFLKDPTQIGIEFTVPQISKEMQTQISGSNNPKAQVYKDVVIWPKPKMTCWDSNGKPTISPSAILQWKFNKKDVDGKDVEWLKEFAKTREDFVGYAICVDQKCRSFRLSCTRIHFDSIEAGWLYL